MSQLQSAIQKITYADSKFPKEEFQIIAENKEEAIPYLRAAIEKAFIEKMELEEGYQLHFYALFFLGEFQDRDYFEKIVEFASLPRDVIDYLIGDTVTSGLKDILYCTYNGEIELLKNVVSDEQADEFVRSAFLDVMGQLYLDGKIDEKDWRDFLRQNIYTGNEYSYIYNAYASMICRCHFVDMLPDIKYMLENNLMDEMVLGKYDSCVDEMFLYRDFDEDFCEKQINAADTLKTWAIFEKDEETILADKKAGEEFVKLMKEQVKKRESKEQVRKIGRNDPCTCGSGKKYKFCCLNKPLSPLDKIEDIKERNECLLRYPYLGSDKKENHVYLEDYYDAESIEIDKMLYLGLMHRAGWIWLRDERKEETRCKEYLKLAFSMFMEKVEKENITTFEEYDQRFSIHYFCEEWTAKLLEFHKNDGEKQLYNDVRECRKNML